MPPFAKNRTVGVAIDNDVQVFLNGVDISGGMRTSGGCAVLNAFVFSAPDSLLITGANLLAVRGHDFGVEAYLDVEVRADVPA